MSYTQAGRVVVKRKWQPIRKGRARARTGWTLHRDDCTFVQRPGTQTLPAPAQPYPDTVVCTYCRPGEPHETQRTDLPDGSVALSCACGVEVAASTYDAARLRMRRRHPSTPQETPT